MFAGQRSSQRRHEGGHFGEQGVESLPPIGACHVDQRVHVDVRVTGMAEDHPANLLTVECGADAGDVFAEALGRHGAVLDELH